MDTAAWRRSPLEVHDDGVDQVDTVRHDDWAEALSTAEDFAAVQAIVTRAARRLVRADGATIVFRHGDNCFYADEDSIAPLWKGQRFPIRECVSGWVMLHREPAVVRDIYVDDRVPTDAYRPTYVRSMVMVPIRAEEPLGAIGAYWAVRHFGLGVREVDALQGLAEAAARTIGELGLENAPWAPNFRVDEARS